MRVVSRAFFKVTFLVVISTFSFPFFAHADGVFEGRFVEAYIDYLDGSHKKLYSLITDDGQAYQLNRSQRSGNGFANLQTGDRVRIFGSRDSSRIDVRSLTRLQSQISRNVSRQRRSSGPDVRSIAMVLVNLDEKTTSCSKKEIEDTVFYGQNSMRALIEASSRNQVTFSDDFDSDGAVDFFGPVTVPESSGSCDDVYGWGLTALKEITPEIQNYQHIVFILPDPDKLDCAVGGLAEVGCGDFCFAWMLSCRRAKTWAHELGHNLGLGHASVDADNDGEIDHEYGDLSCPMGSGVNVLLNAPHQDALGWFDKFPDSIETAVVSQRYVIAPLEDATEKTEALHVVKVPKSDGDIYYLSYRRAMGEFNELNGNYQDRVHVHRILPLSIGENSKLLATLSIGESWDDPEMGARFCVKELAAEFAVVDVLLDSEDCDEASTLALVDSDGDGVSDSKEFADRTNRLDPGSYKETLGSPVRTLWNGFLGMMNILELVNPASEGSTKISVSLFSIDGNLLSRRQLTLAAGQQVDLILNQIEGFQANSYGLVEIEYSASLAGRMSYYRPAGTEYEFAYSVELAPPLFGETAVGFNTFQPSINSAERDFDVLNWLSVVNLSAKQKSFDVFSYDQSGKLLQHRELHVPAMGRVDVDGGHGFAGSQVVGLHRIVPNDSQAPYIAQLIRYGSNARATRAPTGFFFAFPMLARAGNGQASYLPISNQFSESNWVEIVNTGDSSVEVLVDWYNSNELVKSTQLSIAPYSQQHLNADSGIFFGNERGFVRVTPDRANSIIAQSMFYHRDVNSGSIEAMYGIQAKESLGNVHSGSYNLFLGMDNWLLFSNTSTTDLLGVEISTNSVNGKGNKSLLLAPGETKAIAMHDEDDLNAKSDTYGSVSIRSSIPRLLIVDLLRVRETSNQTDFVFPTRMMPSNISVIQ